MWYDSNIIDASIDEECDARRREGLSDDAFSAIARVGILCNNARFMEQDSSKPIGCWECTGNDWEIGLLKYFEITIGDVWYIRNRNKKVAEIPFDPIKRYQVSIHEQQNDGQHLLVMKGAPERILEKCTKFFYKDQEELLDDDRKEQFNSAILELGKMGKRVMAFCYHYLPTDEFPVGFDFDVSEPNFPLDNLVLAGLVAFDDYPRTNVREAVDLCRQAGVKPVLVSGDHPATVEAYARCKLWILYNHYL